MAKGKLFPKKSRQPKLNSPVRRVLWWFSPLIVLVSLIALSQLTQIILSLRDSLMPNFQSSKLYSWAGDYAFNVIVKTREIALLHYDPEGKKIKIVKLPAELYLKVPGGYGDWKLKSIYALGEAEKPPKGSILLRESLSYMLGLPVDGVIIVKKDESLDTQRLLQDWRRSKIRFFNFLSSIRTDLTFWEFHKLFFAISEVREGRLEIIDLYDSTITQTKLLNDATQVLGVDTVKLDLWIREALRDERIYLEEIPIAIFNATNHPGLAQTVARIITNLGGNVIIVGNTLTPSEQTLVVLDSQDSPKQVVNSTTFKRLARFLAPQCATGLCQFADQKVSSSRGQINIIVGEDFYQRFK